MVCRNVRVMFFNSVQALASAISVSSSPTAAFIVEAALSFFLQTFISPRQ